LGDGEQADVEKMNESKTEEIRHEKSTEIVEDKQSTDEKRLVVKVVKRDKESKLCGPAVLNEIVVKNGDIFGVQSPSQSSELSSAVKTNINYLSAFSKYVGRQIELKLTEGTLEPLSEIKAGIIKDMEDINLQLDGRAVRFIITNNKKIDVRGPMFVIVECSFEDIEDEGKNKQTEEKVENNSLQKGIETNLKEN
jgi:O-phosphoseryl-tRNA(Cys) synthetase